ncbi:glycoside hydrolase family 97 protein [Hymenobacter sp. PAMC 26628]|uniref:glycoside hydrolase family 97 protein n=1 Tax=Hymenobacter sp. PAMC 26628 TaxID=1484118 RepID=UPI0007703F07|nr:glycoside hydrolase family 97 protein [Hymenobacter sp. PAMC 26628]AMJ65915.1 glycoside hydrolase [Hymenobacter sp. PAMC 26628]
MRLITSFLIGWLLCSGAAQAQRAVRLKSPDGQLVFTFRLTPRAPVYQVSLAGQPVVAESALGLVFKEGGPFSAGLKLLSARPSQTDETYALPVGKNSRVRNHYRQVVLALQEKAGARRQVNVVVRAFDDGLAFRYEFPAQKNWASYVLTEENSTFNLAGNPTVLTLFRENYTTSHEGLYSRLPLAKIQADTLMDLPTLFELPGRAYLAITEAAVRDYATLYLAKHDGVLTSRLSPLPGQTDVKVVAALPHRSPWRVLLLGRRVETLLESNIVASLNEPPAIQDFSWLRPGLSTFHWWNGDVVPDTTFSPGLNFETNKYYIDFCARHGLAYHSVIGYGGVAWYVNDGISYAPGPHSDVTRPVPSLDMQQVCDYAKSKGVGIRVWVHWQPFYAQLDKALAQFEAWGVQGMMVDFMDRDDQQMVNMQEEMLRKAAQHHLHIQFHGAAKPTGLARTYPNEFTREGTLNYENNKWAGPMLPDHDLNMPFTRGLAGPTDYHLGGFRAVPLAQFKPQQTRPLMVGTRCHMLAMYVVLESPLGLVCDYPAAYENQPGFEFITALPTVWDETRVPQAAVGQYACFARRRGPDWYVGTINSSEARTLALKLDFLPAGEYEATLFGDAPDVATDPNHLVKQTRRVRRSDVVELNLAAGGGQVMVLRKQR